MRNCDLRVEALTLLKNYNLKVKAVELGSDDIKAEALAL